MAETERERIIRLRKELGSWADVGRMIDRSDESIRRYELPGAKIPKWYGIVLEELHRRKKSGRATASA